VCHVLCGAQAQKLQSDNDMLLRQVEIFTLEKAEMLGQIQVCAGPVLCVYCSRTLALHDALFGQVPFTVASGGFPQQQQQGRPGM
jgi:hypothetical protein